MRHLAGLLLMLASSQEEFGLHDAYVTAIRKSKAVVRIEVLAEQWFLRDPRTLKITTSSDHKRVMLHNLVEGILGRISRVRVVEVIKGGHSVKIGNNISIFLPGAGLSTSDLPYLDQGKQYVICVDPLVDDVKFRRVEMIDLKAVDNRRPFDVKESCVLVSGAQGVLRLRSSKDPLVDAVRRAVR